jgi:hypothetical protein
MKKFNKEGTKSSSFGTNGRINHDSSKFYDSKVHKKQALYLNCIKIQPARWCALTSHFNLAVLLMFILIISHFEESDQKIAPQCMMTTKEFLFFAVWL